MSTVSAKTTLVGLTLLFLFPLVMAWLMYSGVIDYSPRETRNHGTLVNPPVEAKLPQEIAGGRLNGKWVLLYALPAACHQECRTDIAGLRQMDRALGRDAHRVHIVHLAPAAFDTVSLDEISHIDPNAFTVRDHSGMLSAQLRDIEGASGSYLIDPLGNIMMYYHAGSDPNDIRLDLERLLKYSKTDSG